MLVAVIEIFNCMIYERDATDNDDESVVVVNVGGGVVEPLYLFCSALY